MLLQKSCAQEDPGEKPVTTETDAQIFQPIVNLFVTDGQNFRTSVQGWYVDFMTEEIKLSIPSISLTTVIPIMIRANTAAFNRPFSGKAGTSWEPQRC